MDELGMMYAILLHCRVMACSCCYLFVLQRLVDEVGEVDEFIAV